MEVDLSLGSLVNAAGSFLFFLAGIAIVALGRFRRRGLLLGGTAALFGIAYVSENLLEYTGENPLPVASYALTAVPAAMLLVGLALDVMRDAAARERRTFALAASLLSLFATAYIGLNFFRTALASPWFGIGGALLRYAMMLLAIAVVLRVRSGPLADERAWARVALAFTIWMAFNAASNLAAFSASAQALAPWRVFTYLAPLGFLAMMVPVSRDRPASRAVFFVTLACALAGVAFGVLLQRLGGEDGFGAYGVVRVVGVVLLALAVLRSDILGVALPRVVVRQGAIATGTLAVLFIVAQLAQNFLAAQYGLILGGVVAGAFLFAAQPLQRALEGRSAPREGVGKNDDAFRAAVRLAFKDRRFSQDEELALADLAERLGIGARRATEIRHEVEADPRREPREPS